MMRFLRALVPSQARFRIRRFLQEKQRQLKAPKMLWGYLDSSGAWRPRTRISDTAFLYHSDRISMEDNVFIWHYTILDGTGGLEIMEGAQIGAWVGLFTHGSHIAIRIYGRHYNQVQESEKVGYPIKKVTIGKYAFIGAGAIVLPGVSIGMGALVCAGAVVGRSVGDFEIVSGNPAEVIGDTKALDMRYLKDPQIDAWYREWQSS